MREAALARLHGGLATPFWVASVAYRLNDWVPQVRAAAAAAARRVFAETEPSVMAAAAPVLMGRRHSWRRWGPGAAVLDEAFAREAVAECLVAMLLSPAARAALLRDALRTPAIDRHLLHIAEDATAPAVRAEAMRTLIDGRARWPAGYERKWVDKSHGLWRRATTYAERPVTRPVVLEALVARAAEDRSALVRRLAADAAIRHRSALANLDEIRTRLRHDRSPAVRERIAYLDRGSPEATAPGGA